MKKTLIIIFMVILCSLLFSQGIYAGEDPAAADIETEELATASDNELIVSAIEKLTEYWKSEMFGENYSDQATGYLGIRNVRIIRIKDEIEPYESEFMSEQAEKLFSDVQYIVSFVLFSDYMQTGGPLYLNANVYDHVVVYDDGTMQVCSNPIGQFVSMTFCPDFSGFIESVSEYDSEYNADYYLIDATDTVG